MPEDVRTAGPQTGPSPSPPPPPPLPPPAPPAAGQAPLAARMRPRPLDEFVGQEQIVGEGRLLRKAIEAGEPPSMVLWGPPGSGKTTLARIIAGLTRSHFEPASAVSSGVADPPRPRPPAPRQARGPPARRPRRHRQTRRGAARCALCPFCPFP